MGTRRKSPPSDMMDAEAFLAKFLDNLRGYMDDAGLVHLDLALTRQTLAAEQAKNATLERALAGPPTNGDTPSPATRRATVTTQPDPS